MSSIPKTVKLAQALMLAGMMTAAIAAPNTSVRTYIVQLSGAPTASYRGEIAHLAATQVPEGQKLNARTSAVQAYRGYLAGKRQAALAAIGAPVKVLHQYDMAFNGFAASMTEAQAAKLRASGKVLSVTADERRDSLTLTTPHFLGLDIPGGVWSKKVKGALEKGENIIVAVIDGGVQPESPAFYDQVDANGTPVKSGGTLAYEPLPAGAFTGSCTTGAGFPVDSCNNKLIGAQVFSASFKTAAAAGAVVPFFGDFYDVPRDDTGHGTHTLSTAGGNANAPAYTSTGIYIGTTSGIAPRARVASYKALFGVIRSDGTLSGSGFTGDLVAAIDKAVADGVDVINYSVSGSQTSLVDPVETAFLNASAAGVFVAASAGNSGPGNQVAHPSPWLTTVAASTHDRQFVATLSLGDGSGPYTGPSFTPNALPNAGMVLSSDIAATDVPVANANLCFAGSLDSNKAAGKIVVCDRGTNDRVAKSAEVKRVGGVGMVLINPVPGTLVADFHSVPTVHLPETTRTAIRNYVTTAGAGANGAISARSQVPDVVAPVMASFSSRGPNLADNAVMKPEITAPGVDVIASVSFLQTTQAQHDAILAGTFAIPPVVDSYQGTSMSSPHIAGVAALIRQAHPNWAPAAIKSAMLTTATEVKLATGATDTDVNGYGAGHVNPNGTMDPGLVYSADTKDYQRFMCGAGWMSVDSETCAAVGSMAPTDLNLPTFQADVPGSLVIKRRVRNVGREAATYTATASLPGYEATVTPSTLSLAKGQAGSFTLTLRNVSAAIGSRATGKLVWQDGTHTVTSPILARALLLSAPSLVSSTAATGSSKFKVKYGFEGSASSLVTGLKPATRTVGTVTTNTQLCYGLPVPADALALRAALYDSDTTGQGADDLDLALYNSANVLVASSGGATSNELVTLRAPAAGNYTLCVQGYAPAGGTSTYTLSTWVLSAADAGGSLTAKGLPASVALGDEATVTAKWSGLAPARYLGGIRYAKGDGTVAGMTLLTVEPGVPATLQGESEMVPSKAKALAAR